MRNLGQVLCLAVACVSFATSCQRSVPRNLPEGARFTEIEPFPEASTSTEIRESNTEGLLFRIWSVYHDSPSHVYSIDPNSLVAKRVDANDWTSHPAAAKECLQNLQSVVSVEREDRVASSATLGGIPLQTAHFPTYKGGVDPSGQIFTMVTIDREARYKGGWVPFGGSVDGHRHLEIFHLSDGTVVQGPIDLGHYGGVSSVPCWSPSGGHIVYLAPDRSGILVVRRPSSR